LIPHLTPAAALQFGWITSHAGALCFPASTRGQAAARWLARLTDARSHAAGKPIPLSLSIEQRGGVAGRCCDCGIVTLRRRAGRRRRLYDAAGVAGQARLLLQHDNHLSQRLETP